MRLPNIQLPTQTYMLFVALPEIYSPIGLLSPIGQFCFIWWSRGEEKKYSGVFVIVNTYIPAGQEFLFCTNTIKSHISCLQFYATNNWKDFPKTSSWRRTSWPLFGLHTYIFLLLDTRGHIRRDNRLTGLRVSQYRGWEEYTWKPFLHLTTHGSDYEPHKYSPLNPNYPQFSLKLHPKMPMAVLRTSYIIYGAQWKWKWESSSWKVFRISVTAGHWTI